MKTDQKIYEEIKNIINKKDLKKAEEALVEFSIQVDANPNYSGLYWRA